jgi:uncharacterized membrane protein (DUF106 family)
VDIAHVVQVWKIVAKITSQFLESKGIDNKRLERLENHIETLRAEMKSLRRGKTDSENLDRLEDAPEED